ncbi:sulfatase [Halobacteria archaeon HArc-gm2]|nr:sulfatase [Halobacteria archaeon HArc-gm2]
MSAKPNILFLVLDAVRQDHVSCYGYGRETTPTIDRLAVEGVKYDHAFAPSIWTPTVHGAIFTGKYPSHTGIYGNSLGIPGHLETLPETLQREGYRTFAASAGAHIRASRGYDRGVDEYVSTRRISPDIGFVKKLLTDSSYAKQVGFSLTRGPDDKSRYKYDRLQRFVDDAVDAGDPFFGFINAKTPHQPFNPPRPYKQLFSDELDRPSYEFIERLQGALGMETQTVEGYDTEKVRQIAHSGGDEFIAGDIEMSDDEWSVIESWYDGAIRYLDDLIGNLLEFLKSRDVYDDTLLVVTSDHGDHFGDHGLTSHIFCVYDTITHVPLVIKPPAGGPAGRSIDNQITLVDLHKTFVEAAGGVDPNPEYSLTESLLDFEERQYHEHTFCEYAGFEGPIKRIQRKYPDLDLTQFAKTIQSVRDEEHKLIHESTGKEELYNWREDPLESDNLQEELPDIADRLRTVMETQLKPLDNPGEFETPDDPSLEKQLKDLGYL